MPRGPERWKKLTRLTYIYKIQLLECPKSENFDFSHITKNNVPDFGYYLGNTLYLLDISSKVVGKWWHMDFFCPDWKSYFGRFWYEKISDFQTFFSWEIALVYTMLDHIKLNFHPSNPWSQRAFCQNGQNHYIQAKNWNRRPEVLVLAQGPNFIWFLIHLDG